MRETEYTFAVARIRANENSLLTSSEYSSVIAAGSFEEAARRLNDKGYAIEGTDYAPALEKRYNGMLQLIEEILPDRSQFDSIWIDHDFQNLKVIQKSMITGKSAEGLLLYPTVYDAKETEENIRNRCNSRLPEPLQHADRSAYRILTRTSFAQLSDSVIDRASMEWSITLAKKADHPIMLEIAEKRTALADIKVLYRCIKAQKAKSFMERCVAACSAFDKDVLIRAALGGMEDFCEALSHTELAGAAEALKVSPTAFEKWCDDRFTEMLKKAKTETFGIASIAAYYYAVETEIRNVRIILSAKRNGFPEEQIRERVRAAYV